MRESERKGTSREAGSERCSVASFEVKGAMSQCLSSLEAEKDEEVDSLLEAPARNPTSDP